MFGKQQRQANTTRILRCETLKDRRLLATIPVTLNSDSLVPDPTDGEITLREAVQYISEDFILDSTDPDALTFDFANLGTNDKIVFDNGVFGDLSIDPNLKDTITLSHGELLITNPVEIDGDLDGPAGPPTLRRLHEVSYHP